MKIICDHCDHQISGTVKVLAGTLNLHPDCMAELGKDPKNNSTAILWPSHDDSVVLLESRGHQAFDLAKQ